jgi:hypothetical protein
MAKEQSKISQMEAGPEVDRIRDIIFGPQMREYEQRFTSIKHDLDRLQQEVDRLAEQLNEQDGTHNKKLQALRKETRQGDDALREELRQIAKTLTGDKVDRIALGELFTELGAHLKTGGSLTDLLERIGVDSE